MNKEIINGEDVEQLIKSKIYIIRGQKVMLDSDLAELYGVLTKNLNKAVKRNISRFPDDFMFKLSEEEYANRFQIGTGSQKHRDPRYLPYAFTEHGVAMLSSVLNSERAIEMNIFIIRVFIKIKEWILSNKDLEIKVEKIEKKQKEQSDLLNNVNSVLTQLVEKPGKPLGKLGFNE
jgi:hypothetical protein